MIRPGRTLPRTLHPAAWWLWALGLVTAASRTTNPLLLGLIVAVAGYVVTSRRGDAPWALAFRSYLAFGLLVVGIRVGFRVLAGGPQGGHVLLGLPGVTLPGWAAGIELLGPFTLEELLGGFGDGLRLATMLICVGAANALANPKRLLKVVPGALAGVSSAVVVALTVAPQLIESVQRVRRARRLRGGAERGPRVLAAILLPVLADALDRSLALAAALDSRGYGRATGPAAARRGSGALVVAGLAGVCAGLYGLLDPGAPAAAGVPGAAGRPAGGGPRCARGRTAGAAHPLPARPLAPARAGRRRLRGHRRRPRRPHHPHRRRRPAPSGEPARLAPAVAAATARGRRRPPARLARPTPGDGRGGRDGRCREGAMIRLENVTVTYAGAPAPVLDGVDLEIPEGELCLVAGPTGAGKSTLLGVMNGLVPHFTGGTLRGRVTVAGLDTRTHPPRELAHLAGVVGQDPLAGFVTDTVEEELAYGMEQLAVPADVMRRRVEETLDLLGIAELRGRALRTLSGGQQQRVAIGAVLTAHPRVLILDEPTSALDPGAAEDVLATITRLVHDLGVTVVVAEHRLERIVQSADRLVRLTGDGGVVAGDPAAVLAGSPLAPPVAELGRLAGWSPLPLSVRDARGRAGALRERLAGCRPPARPRADGPALLDARDVVVRYGATIAVREVSLALRPGEVAALMGRNGSGKSSLLWALHGAGPRHGGTVRIGGEDPRRVRGLAGLVPQTPGDLLYLDTVGAECAQADAGAPSGTCRGWLDRIAPGVPDDVHPRDLSEGQRLALVLALQLAAEPRVVLLDEPTRGLDETAKRRFAAALRGLAAGGRAVLVATHDVELAAVAADRVVVMAEGEVVTDGPVGEVLAASPSFAPQVAKVLHPAPWLTVAEVAAALDGTP